MGFASIYLEVSKKASFRVKIGDLVRWRGFPHVKGRKWKNNSIGLIIGVDFDKSGQRLDVIWSDGTAGSRLYASTLDVISENRR